MSVYDNGLLGRRVIATNERGGKWRGVCVTFTLDGKAVVDCDGIDIGYGWHPLSEQREFPIGWVEVAKEGDDDND